MHKQSTQFDHSQYISKNTTNTRKIFWIKKSVFNLFSLPFQCAETCFQMAEKISWIVLENKEDKMKAFFFYV